MQKKKDIPYKIPTKYNVLTILLFLLLGILGFIFAHYPDLFVTKIPTTFMIELAKVISGAFIGISVTLLILKNFSPTAINLNINDEDLNKIISPAVNKEKDIIKKTIRENFDKYFTQQIFPIANDQIYRKSIEIVEQFSPKEILVVMQSNEFDFKSNEQAKEWLDFLSTYLTADPSRSLHRTIAIPWQFEKFDTAMTWAKEFSNTIAGVKNIKQSLILDNLPVSFITLDNKVAMIGLIEDKSEKLIHTVKIIDRGEIIYGINRWLRKIYKIEDSNLQIMKNGEINKSKLEELECEYKMKLMKSRPKEG